MPQWLIDIAQVVSAIGVTFLVVEIVYLKRSFRYQALHDIFEIQNNEDFKKMIWVVCSARSLHEVKSKFDNESLPDDVATAVREVSNKFDDVGLFINKKLLDRNAFLAKYFERVLTCYEASNKYIEYEKQGGRGAFYQVHFIKLNQMAMKFKKKKKSDFNPKEALEENCRKNDELLKHQVQRKIVTLLSV